MLAQLLTKKQFPLVAVVGIGVSGKSVIQLLRQLGLPEEKLITFDQKDPSAQISKPETLLERNPEWMIVSPGVPLSSPFLKLAQERGTSLTSELELSFDFLQEEKIIAITGSLGKSTTTALLGTALLSVDRDVFFGGNLGFPLASYVYDVLSGGRPRAQYCVLELSSYQLELFSNLRADIAIFTYLSPNHLERYSDLKSYYQTKKKLIGQTRGLLVLNEHGGDLKKEIGTTSVPTLWCHAQDERMKKYSVTRTGMVGSHNLDNFSLALAALEQLGVAQKCLGAALAFPGLSHRLEKIGSSQGVTFVNDSKATAMDSVLQAVHSVLDEPTCKQIRLLLGGRDKNLPWQELASLSKKKNVLCYFFGECAALAQQKSGLPGKQFAKLEAALEEAFSNSVSYDWILLSPGGTSLDEFKNFEDRGNFFKNWYLKKSNGKH